MTYTHAVTGKRKDIQRRARTRADAIDLRDQLVREIDETDGRSLDHERKTMKELIAYYRDHYAKPAEYVDGKKVAGLRSLDTVLSQLNTIETYFQATSIRSITYDDIRQFRSERMATPVVVIKTERDTRTGKTKKVRVERQRSVATVNRELALLNRLFNVAFRQAWLLRNPFANGEPLTTPSGETHRERIITREEEARLLEACDAAGRRHLRPIIICALDTGMRQGEIFKLTWNDVDLQRRTIHVRAFNTKTMRARQVAMTSRLYAELFMLASDHAGPESSVFGVTDNVKRSFDRVRTIAGLDGVRFHDLRHTAATRLTRGHLSLPEVGRILGHTQPRTTYRYVNADDATTHRAAAILDAIADEEAVTAN
ncbi:MAG: site-specific integrase [Acidobacteria bacterium]|nr:site-specific integrase [Acidobacteriota bacterium]